MQPEPNAVYLEVTAVITPPPEPAAVQSELIAVKPEINSVQSEANAVQPEPSAVQPEPMSFNTCSVMV